MSSPWLRYATIKVSAPSVHETQVAKVPATWGVSWEFRESASSVHETFCPIPSSVLSRLKDGEVIGVVDEDPPEEPCR